MGWAELQLLQLRCHPAQSVRRVLAWGWGGESESRGRSLRGPRLSDEAQGGCRAALQAEDPALMGRGGQSGWRLFQGRGPGAGVESMAVDPIRESLADPGRQRWGSGPDVNGLGRDPVRPDAAMVRGGTQRAQWARGAEFLAGPRREEELFKEDEGRGGGVGGSHASGGTTWEGRQGWCFHMAGPQCSGSGPGGTLPEQAHGSEPGRQTAVWGPCRKDRAGHGRDQLEPWRRR